MKVMSETAQPAKSKYVLAGAPTRCFMPGCGAAFVTTCVHGEDGHYYCTQECTDAARTMGLAQVQELRRRGG